MVSKDRDNAGTRGPDDSVAGTRGPVESTMVSKGSTDSVPMIIWENVQNEVSINNSEKIPLWVLFGTFWSFKPDIESAKAVFGLCQEC